MKKSLWKKLFGGEGKNSEAVNKDKVPRQLTKAGGLGDRYMVLEKNYGQNASENEWGKFLDNRLLVRFYNDRAVQVVFQMESAPGEAKNREEARAFAMDIIPADSQTVKEWSINEGTDIRVDFIQFKSELLAKAFAPELFKESSPGKFTVIFTYNRQGIHQITALLGDPPVPTNES